MKIKIIINAIYEEIIPIVILIILGYMAIFFFKGGAALKTASITAPAPVPPKNTAETEIEPIRSAAAAIKQPAATTEITSRPPITKGAIDEQTPIETNARNKQIISGTISQDDGLVPDNYMVKIGVPVRFEIYPKDDIDGCMSTIMIYGLYDEPFLIKKGEKIVMEFTPKQAGEYYVICVMGVEWGKITVAG